MVQYDEYQMNRKTDDGGHNNSLFRFLPGRIGEEYVVIAEYVLINGFHAD